MLSLKKKNFTNIDWPLILLSSMLCLCGLLVLESAGYDPVISESLPMKRQAASMGIGFLFFFIGMAFSSNSLKSSAYFVYALCVLLLVGVLLAGDVAGGARRWINLGGLRVQPSEFMKIGVILAMAKFLTRENVPKNGYTLPTLILPSLMLGLPALLILKQPDLGTALVNIMIGGSMVLLAGVNIKTLTKLALTGALLMIPTWNFVLKDYQKQRVLTFLSPESDPLGSGYHALQSKIAVGSGAAFGKGFLKGTQTQLRFLPEQTTDFIFSVLAEEWGFFGSVFVIFLYGLLISRILSVASKCTDNFSSYVCFGVACLLFWHTLVNIGMVIGILPVVGVTLTLLSFGGSSVMTVLAGVGIVSGFSMRRYMFS